MERPISTLFMLMLSTEMLLPPRLLKAPESSELTFDMVLRVLKELALLIVDSMDSTL